MKKLRIGEGESTLEAREGHVLVTEHRDVKTPEHMRRWLEEIDRFATSHGLDKVIFDARYDTSETLPEVREARWAHTDAAPVLKHIAVVIPTEMAATRLNMTVLARKSAARLRAFTEIEPAAAWLRSRR